MTASRGELLGDLRRQAVPSIQGTVYQAWCSIDAWLKLSDEAQVIYLEGAEDFDVVGGGEGDITVQVKRNEESVSLGAAKARDALENYWALVTRDPSRLVHMHYLTTSSVATERDANFDGQCGIDAWRAARTNAAIGTLLTQYLASKLPAGSALKRFLETAGPTEVQERLYSRFHWFTDQPDIEVVQRSVEDRLVSMLHARGRPASLARTVRVHLEARFWQVITERQSSQRVLTFGDLLRQIEQATTTYLPVPLEHVADLLDGLAPGRTLLRLLVAKVSAPPSPLLVRKNLTDKLVHAVDQRRAVLLTGTVYKGKTTLAQLVAIARCPDAWWLSLSERRPDQVDNVFLALAGAIEQGDCPSLVVIDDLDISPAAHRVFRRSLALVLHRATDSGRGVVLTARGGSSEAAQLAEFSRLDVVEVPELGPEELRALCIERGCRERDAGAWSVSLFAVSRGHPKLVQVRVRELTERGWPAPSIAEFTTPTAGMQSVKQLARRLLAESVPESIAALLYTASESSVPLHRAVLLRVAEYVGIANPGDAVDAIVGKWLECIETHWYRTTSLLQGAAGDVWTQERRQQAHRHLHAAVLLKQTLDPAEAAALLFHGYCGRDWGWVALDALRLQVIDDPRARLEVERNLMWLPYAALERGQFIAGKAETGAPLRALQFRVAVTLDAETLPQILDRWVEEVSAVAQDELRDGMKATMWNSIAIADSGRVPLHHRLSAIQGLTTMTGVMATLSAEGTQRFLLSNATQGGIPENGNTTQVMLALSSRWVRDLDSLRQVVCWLDDASDEVRADFEVVLEWPIVQTMGAFVQGAWAAGHEGTTDWQPWLRLFDQVTAYAVRRQSPRFGREAAKAKATILAEHLGDSGQALQVLKTAEEVFGKAAVLDEQRANVLFQANDDAAVLQIWSDLVARPDAAVVLDPFAYRRAGMSAARLGKYAEAAKTLRAGANSVEPDAFALTRFGLLVDSALAELLDGRIRDAAMTLGRAVLDLPPAASAEGGERWEAVQRAAAEVCRCIEDALWKPANAQPKFDVGYASSPARMVVKAEPGQEARTLFLRAQVALAASSHAVLRDELGKELEHLTTVPYRYVRWVASEARLSRCLGLGNGRGLIEALLSFDSATSVLVRGHRGEPMTLPDQTVDDGLAPSAEQWFGLLVAGAWCCGERIEAALTNWRDTLDRTPGHDKLQRHVLQLQDGARFVGKAAFGVAADGERLPAVRCGAAIAALEQPLTAAQTLQMHGMLVSALVSDASYTRQELYNLHVAKRLANQWRRLAASPFSFRSPRTTLPVLLEAADKVDAGTGTLKTILSAAQTSVGMPTAEYMSRVW